MTLNLGCFARCGPACEKRQSAVRSRLMVNSTRPRRRVSECATSSTARMVPDTDVDLVEVRGGDEGAPNSCTTLC